MIDVDLADSPLPPEPVEGYRAVRALIRIDRTPIGEVTMPAGRAIDDTAIRSAALDPLAWPMLRYLLHRAVGEGGRERPTTGADLAGRLNDASDTRSRAGGADEPTVTVAVCSRDRAADLARCLDALDRLDPPPDAILVIDNAPATDSTASVVAAHSKARYVCEPVPGLDRARNRAIRESHTDIVAFTDDDVIVDRGWVGAIRRAFSDYPDAAAVTGLVLPLEIETRAQQLFEEYGGFGRGFVRRVYHVPDPGRGHAIATYGGTGQVGTGANMAYRRDVFEEIGLFDPALDVGTPTNGGGDLDMFFRVLRAGRTLVYEPAALVRHRHRRDDDALMRQIANNGVGFYAYLCRQAFASREDRRAVIQLAAWWFLHWDVRRVINSIVQPGRFQRDLSCAELLGSIYGPFRYRRSRAECRRIDPGVEPRPAAVESRQTPSPHAALVVQVDLGRPLEEVCRAIAYRTVRVFVSWDGTPLGDVTVENDGERVTAARLRDAIVDGLGAKLLGRSHRTEWLAYGELLGALRSRVGASPDREAERLDHRTAISVVVPTRNRPDDLGRCLASLVAQATRHPVQILVVDNDPDSGMTPPIVARFPSVSYITERRQGLSYARNAGIAASRGSIVVATDDDVVAPPDWIEQLVTPFADPDVSIVTGNVLPYRLDTKSQADFEAYGGLGKGYESKRVDGDWFWAFRGAVPTWELGATANAAFRASIFTDPAIGLFDEALGAGMPTGCSEDTYLFYRVLKTGGTLVYEPRAFVWHRHRDDAAALRRQIYNYAKGHAAYQLTTLFRDGDMRALARLLFRLPQTYCRRTLERLRGRSDYSVDLIVREVLGTLAGPAALWRARRIVTRRGRSQAVAPMPREVHDAVPMESAAAQEAAPELVVAVSSEPARPSRRLVRSAPIAGS